MASSASNTSKLDKPVSLVWGCELSEQNKTFVFKVEDDDEDKYEHQLALRMVCLGDKAKDEFHIVEIVTQEMGAEKPVPIATLKPSILPMVSMGIDLVPPVNFRLKAGSGPVYISGQHIVMEEDLSWAEDEDEGEAEGEEEEEEEEEEDPESPPKAVKRPAATKKAGQAKKKKLDKEDESSEEDSPTKKGKGAGRGRKPAAKK